MNTRVTVKGADSVAKALLGLGDGIRDREATKIMGAGADILINAARSKLTAVDTGLLKASLGKVVRKNKSKKTVRAVVGPRGDAEFTRVKASTGKIVQRPTKYAHLVEFGTAPHNGHPGTKARPFMRPAFDESSQQVMAKISDGIGKAVEKLAQEADRKGGK